MAEFKSWGLNFLNHKDGNSAPASSEAVAALGRCLVWFLHKPSCNCSHSALQNRLFAEFQNQVWGNRWDWYAQKELGHAVCNTASVTSKISAPHQWLRTSDPHPWALVCTLQQWYLTQSRNIIIHTIFFCKKRMPGIILKCILLKNSQPRKEDLGPVSSTKYALICIQFVPVTRCFRISSTNIPIFLFVRSNTIIQLWCCLGGTWRVQNMLFLFFFLRLYLQFLYHFKMQFSLYSGEEESRDILCFNKIWMWCSSTIMKLYQNYILTPATTGFVHWRKTSIVHLISTDWGVLCSHKKYASLWARCIIRRFFYTEKVPFEPWWWSRVPNPTGNDIFCFPRLFPMLELQFLQQPHCHQNTSETPHGSFQKISLKSQTKSYSC